MRAFVAVTCLTETFPGAFHVGDNGEIVARTSMPAFDTGTCVSLNQDLVDGNIVDRGHMIVAKINVSFSGQPF